MGNLSLRCTSTTVSWQPEGRVLHAEKAQLWSAPGAVFQKINCFKLKKKIPNYHWILFIYLLFLLQRLDSTLPDSRVLGLQVYSTTPSHPHISKPVSLLHWQSRLRYHSHSLTGSRLAVDAQSLGRVLGKAIAAH